MKNGDLGILQMQILWLLENQPIHGYELMKRLNAIKKTKIGQGTLYPTMQKLMDAGYVISKEDGNRKVYSVTPKGKKKMESSCEEFVGMFKCIFERYSYGKNNSHENLVKLLPSVASLNVKMVPKMVGK